MGLAILPARLKDEMIYIKEALLQEKSLDEKILGTHFDWVKEIMHKHTYTKENIDALLQDEIGQVFVRVLEDAGVFKLDQKGIEAFKRFVSCLGL